MEGLQPGSLRLGAPRPDNVTVVEERENVRFKEEKKRLRKKLRETVKEIDVAGHLLWSRDPYYGTLHLDGLASFRILSLLSDT